MSGLSSSILIMIFAIMIIYCKMQGYRVTMNQQVSNFAKALEEIRRVNFQEDAKELQNYIKRCIIFSGMGSNDYLNNYFLPNSTSSSKFTPTAYATALIQEYRHQLEDLYQLGARKFIILGPGKIGCLPYELEMNNKCNEYKNDVTNIFNTELLKLVDTFNKGKLPGATFVFLDVFQDVEGFEVVNKACCGFGKSNGKATCLPHQTPCENRTQYKYWDSFHPTEKANILFAERAYKSPSKF